MKIFMNKVIFGLVLFSTILIAGHPEKYLKGLKEESKNDGQVRDSSPKVKDWDTFAGIITDFFGNRRQFGGNEVANLYNIYNQNNDYVFFRWLVTLSNNLVSRDLYSTLYFGSRESAIEMLEGKPDGTGLLRAVYHDKGSIAITYREGGETKHALLDVSSLTNYNLRNVLFCKKLDFLTHLMVLHQVDDGQGGLTDSWRTVPRTLLSYPVDPNLVSDIN